MRHAGPDSLVFCQVGRFVEFYGPQRERAARVLRLVRVRMARGGYGFSVGFPASLRGAYLSRAVRAGYVVADVREVDRMEPRCATRTIVAVWSPRGRATKIAAS
jgi:DNA mismatch repair ATPase MutS